MKKSTFSVLFLLVFSAAEIHASYPKRVVVTLRQYNACEVASALFAGNAQGCATQAKCYGRRLVLNVEQCTFSSSTGSSPDALQQAHEGSAAYADDESPLQPVEEWVKSIIPAEDIATVEEDSPLVANGLGINAFHRLADRSRRRKDDSKSTGGSRRQEESMVQAQEVLLPQPSNPSPSLRPAATPQWNLDMLNIWGTWEAMGTYGEGSIVAVLDSGVAETALPAFEGRIKPGYDFISDPVLSKDGDGRDADFYDPGDMDSSTCPQFTEDSYHGTKVASVLAANFSNFFGVAPMADVLPVRVLGRCGNGYASDVADAIVWAAGGEIHGLQSNHQNEAGVIVMAFAGLGRCPSFMQTAVDLAVARNISLYAAAGNNPALHAKQHFPANCRGVVSVGALTPAKEVASYSSKFPDAFMPGGDSENAVPCLGADLSIVAGCVGTSMSAPHAGGLAALRRMLLDEWMTMSDSRMDEAWQLQLYDPSKYVNAKLLVTAEAKFIAAGKGSSSCAILKTNKVMCWGDKLGDGTSGSSAVPRVVPGITDSIPQDLVLGMNHVFVRMANGSIYCWGSNAAGQCGTGNATASALLSPTLVTVFSSDDPVLQLAPGHSHTCALLANSRVVKCWGDNSNSQLGIGVTGGEAVLVPQQVSVIAENVTMVSSFNMHTCALAVSGKVFCWGRNVEWQIGDGTQTQRNVPTEVAGIGGSVSYIAVGFRASYTVRTDGVSMNWGSSSYGGLGDGVWAWDGKRTTPFQVRLVAWGKAVWATEDGAYLYAPSTATQPVMYGYGRVNGGVIWPNNANADAYPEPMPMYLPAPTYQFSVGGKHACGLKSISHHYDVRAYCWGVGDSGQLGDGTRTSKTMQSPALVALGTYNAEPVASTAKQVSCGFYHTCVVLEANAGMKCWGDNTYTQIGFDLPSPSTLPQLMTGIAANVVQAFASVIGTLALGHDGKVYSWGTNSQCQLGRQARGCNVDFTADRGAVDAVEMTTAVKLESSNSFFGGGWTPGWSCAIRADQTMACWGTTNNNVRAGVNTIGKVLDVTMHMWSTCALLLNGTVACWGLDVAGSGSTAVVTADLGGLAAVQINRWCALLTNGRVKCWKDMGNGINAGADALVGTVTQFDVGVTHACAVMSTGSVKCWGNDGFSQVSGANNLVGTAVQVSVGYEHSCAVMSNGELRCWGANYYGQLGDGTTTSPRSIPVSPALGYYYDPLVLPCNPGFYGPNSNGSCLPCSPGSYSNANWSLTCTACPVGTYASEQNMTSCTPCPAGKFSTVVGSTSASTCRNCSVGTYSPEGSSTCFPCPLGTVSDGTVSCSPCSPGTTPSSGLTDCIACQPGSSSASLTTAAQYPPSGMTDHTSSRNSITYRAASYSTLETAYAWKAFDNLANNYRAANSFSSAGVLTIPGVYFADDTAFPGIYLGIDMGQRVQVTSYKIRMGPETSVSNQRRPKTWKIYATNSDSCWVAGAPHKLNTGAAHGWVQIDYRVDQTSYTDSSAFSVQVISPHRYWAMQVNALIGPSYGTILDIGEWSITGFGSDMVKCQPCAPGTFSPSAGSSSCTPCQAGKFAAANGTSTCTDCPRGAYAPTVGAGTCTPCPIGTYSDLVGAFLNTTCVKCPPGTFAPATGSSTCTTCPKGSFVSTAGANACTTCPSGTASNL